MLPHQQLSSLSLFSFSRSHFMFMLLGKAQHNKDTLEKVNPVSLYACLTISMLKLDTCLLEKWPPCEEMCLFLLFLHASIITFFFCLSSVNLSLLWTLSRPYFLFIYFAHGLSVSPLLFFLLCLASISAFLDATGRRTRQ